MFTWQDFARERPDIASAGRAIFYQFGVGLAFLGTTRPDGGPRVHPMCPLLTDLGLYAFIVPSPKQRDLQRDGRYAMHSFPCADNEDAFYVTGRASSADDGEARARLSAQFVAERLQFNVPPPADDHLLFEFSVERCLLTNTSGHGDTSPEHTVWAAPR